MYSNLPNLILGFHGCDETTYQNVIHNNEPLRPSQNTYDWLGNGIYFWEQNCARAWDWANQHYPETPAVIGAAIDLGYCLNLTDYASKDVLRMGYELLVNRVNRLHEKMPENIQGKSRTDVLLRKLDCAVIEQLHQYNEDASNNDEKIHKRSYDSVRGIFTEGEPVYLGACLLEKTHVQICVRNPNCIKGYFSPLTADPNFIIP